MEKIIAEGLEVLTSCPVCGSGEPFQYFLDCRDFTVSQEIFHLVKCTGCGFVFTNPRPDEKSIGKYYESDDYISHSNSNKGFFNKLYQKARNYSLDKKLGLLNHISRKGELLDIGCGTGEFLNRCRKDGWEVRGVEPGVHARKFAVENYGLDVGTTDRLKEFVPGSFDVITMWHVLEHVHRLRERVEELESLLKPGGILIVAVPNRESYDARKFQEFWAAYDVPRHLYHFTKKDIRYLFREKFDLKRILPMKLDSYYVSLLSSKYRTGSRRWAGSFLTGLQSNLSGSRQNNYSSLIYILERR